MFDLDMKPFPIYFTDTFNIIIYCYTSLNVFLSLRYMHVAVALIDLKKIHNVK